MSVTASGLLYVDLNEPLYVFIVMQHKQEAHSYANCSINLLKRCSLMSKPDALQPRSSKPLIFSRRWAEQRPVTSWCRIYGAAAGAVIKNSGVHYAEMLGISQAVLGKSATVWVNSFLIRAFAGTVLNWVQKPRGLKYWAAMMWWALWQCKFFF